MKEPRTTAGRALLDHRGWVGRTSDLAYLIARVEEECLSSQTIDVERLRRAHRALFLNSGYGMFGGYLDALVDEYTRIGLEAS